MPRHTETPAPEGYTIVRIQGRHYPMKIECTEGSLLARGYIDLVKRAPVSFSKRFYAVTWLYSVATGARTLGETIKLSDEPVQRGLNAHDNSRE